MKQLGHSPVGASSMHRWANCPGSVRLSRGIASTTSEYALEGTRAHSIAAFYLENQSWPQDADSETIEAVQVYSDAVFQDKRELDSAYNGNLFFIERGFSLTTVHPSAYGTSDCIIYDAKKKLLRVYDYKHGKGISVDVENNEQLKYYGLGALLEIGVPAVEVELVIVQPRCPHPDGTVRRWRFNALDLVDFAADLRDAILRTEEKDATLNPGDWCRFCPAAGICPSLQQKALVTAQNIFAPTEKYDPVVLADTLDKLPMLEAFIKQVHEFAYAEAMKGRLPPGYKLVQKRSTRKWRDESGAATMVHSIATSNNNYDQCFTEPELKSPAQLEKVLKKDYKKLERFVESVSSGYKLAKNDEPGDPVLLDAKTVFETEDLFS